MTATPHTRNKNASLLVPYRFTAEQGAKRPNRRVKTITVPTVGSEGHFVSPPGLAVLKQKKLTTGRMTRILRAIGITVSQHAVWVGWPLQKYIDANPAWSEFDWYQMACESRELILNPPEITTRKPVAA